MPSDLERKLQNGDFVSLSNAFQKVIEAVDMTNQPLEDRIMNVLFISQVRQYILEGIPELKKTQQPASR